jgi:hypothetical protein
MKHIKYCLTNKSKRIMMLVDMVKVRPTHKKTIKPIKQTLIKITNININTKIKTHKLVTTVAINKNRVGRIRE